MIYFLLKGLFGFIGCFIYVANNVATVFLGYQPLWYYTWVVYTEFKLRRFK